MKIEIWSDVVCPFCYIGKRNFEMAIQGFEQAKDLEIVWKSFQLDPSISKEITPEKYSIHLSQKTGWSEEETEKAMESIGQMAHSIGLVFNLNNTKAINTFDIHKLIQYAKLKNLGAEAEEAFFKAYFTDQKELNLTETQIEIFESLGFSKTDYESAMNDELYEKMVRADITEAQLLGIKGVPFFVFNRKYGVSGAQPAEVFSQTLETAFEEWQNENLPNDLKIINGQSCDLDGNCN